ncbi:MAG: hypothetical protein NTV70_24950 [Acidobacteria bacterium]|nr:hypothetical protein [Acidobacteriota bacterium]
MDSVTRGWPHWKTGRLDKLVTALTAFQTTPAAAELKYLYKRLYRWIEKNPNEFHARSRLVGQLAYEIERRAVALGASVMAEAREFRRVTLTSAPQLWTPLVELTPLIAVHNANWSNIEVTDLPTGVPGEYNFSAGNVFSEGDRNVAIQEMGHGAEVQLNKQYWLRLGLKVLTPQSNGIRYGRCFSCAAAVIYSLVRDQTFDDYTIEHIGSTDFDHHLILVGRSNANGVSEAGLADGWDQWKWTGVIIDVWQARLNGNADYGTLAHQNRYAGGHLRWFCVYSTGTRAVDRNFTTRLVAPVRGEIVRLDIAEEAREALQNQGHATRNRKVDRRWIVEEEIAPGVWQEVRGGGNV